MSTTAIEGDAKSEQDLRRGYLGGSFDPVHRGHINLARVVAKAAQLDACILLPTALSPFKAQEQAPAAASHRLAMLRLAIQDAPELSIDARELAQSGPCYSVHTMAAIAKEHPQDELFFILGMDSLRGLERWHDVDKFLALAHLLVVARPGSDNQSVIKKVRQRFAGIRLDLIECPLIDVSSGALRAAIATGKNPASQLTPEVWRYIQTHQLYTQAAD